MQHAQLARRAQAQKDRLSGLFPLMMQTHMAHPRTACYSALGPGVLQSLPFALQWAFALVRSRAFSAGNDQFAFVPFLDMANHNFNPNANFTFDSAIGSFKLTALTDVKAGSQVFISYGQTLDDGKLATQYGFCVASDENPNPPPLADMTAKGPQLMSAADLLKFEELLSDASEAHFKRLGTSSTTVPQHYTIVCAKLAQLAAVSHAHPPTAAAQLLAGIQSYRKAEFPTSLEEDLALQSRILAAAGKGANVDKRFLFALEYRMRRKDTHMLATDLLGLIVGSDSAGA
eukprot:TRINITY_DN4587_c0_g1_i1.p1 TRINITY_DN4587_c0_g1~~TRINITY_DN4587_c0_g1_i1.p1  ORF type:complete len:288 (-),score=101.68 TRINITY_DN4587_c0_g1_i1:82-945(-)